MWEAHLALIFVQVAYGGLHVIIKSTLTSKDKNLSFCAWADFIALLVLAPFAYFYEKRTRPPITKKTIFYFILLGLTGIVGNQLLFMFGLMYTSPIVASSLQPSTPVLTFILSILFGLETLNLKKISGILKLLGVCVCIMGAFVIIMFQENFSPKEISGSRKILSEILDENFIPFMGFKIEKFYFGIMCLLGHCSSMAVYLIIQAQFLKLFPAPITVTAITYFFGDIFFFIFGLFFIKPSAWILTTPEIGAVLYASLIASALNYSLMTWTNKIVGPSMVALYTPLQPFSSAILSFIFLGQQISLGSVMGGILILCGLYLVTWERSGLTKHIRIENAKE